MRILIALMISVSAHADNTSWVCTDEATTRSGNVWSACGVGEGMNEGIARREALEHALDEFKLMCDMSTSCKGKAREVEPTRSTCSFGVGWVRCYRAVKITLTP